MINLDTIQTSIETHLESIQVSFKGLPSSTNLLGVMRNSQLTYVISEGVTEDTNIVNLKLLVSLSSIFRTTKEGNTELSLNELINLTIKALHKKPIIGAKKCFFKRFEVFTPESGKWLSVLEFTIPTFLFDSGVDVIEPLTKTINQTITVN